MDVWMHICVCSWIYGPHLCFYHCTAVASVIPAGLSARRLLNRRQQPLAAGRAGLTQQTPASWTVNGTDLSAGRLVTLSAGKLVTLSAGRLVTLSAGRSVFCIFPTVSTLHTKQKMSQKC